MRSKSDAFTLLELLVVVAIIAILISLLVPSIGSALERGREVTCQSNLRSIAQAMLAFAGDHNGHLPGSAATGTVPSVSWKRSFMGEEVINEKYRHLVNPAMEKNRMGSLASYLGIVEGEKTRIYRCPSHEAGVPGSGVGSNGMFDYAMMLSLGGVRLSQIPRSAVVYRGRPEERHVLTPLVLEEDPVQMNAGNMEPGHANIDRMGRWHRGGRGFYAAIDGAVFSIESPTSWGPRAVDWHVKVGDRWYTYGAGGVTWGVVPW